jgi:fructose-1,6-bisphosphatase/inositol monophosphatase family enzyme
MPLDDLLAPSQLEEVSAIIRRIAAEEILSRYKRLKDHEIGDKDSGEIVTDADTIGEQRLTDELTRLLPGSVVVGEESYAADESILDRLNGDAPVWILDPVDGTRNFSEGRRRFCVIVALVLRGQTVAGWIYNPLEDEMVSARIGQGITSDKTGLERPAPLPITAMTGSLGQRRRERLAEEAARGHRDEHTGELLRYRCIGLEYVDLIKGIIHFAEYGQLKPWDHAAGLLFIEESGMYAAYTETGETYWPGPIVRERLVVAPDRDHWEQIKKYLPD